MKLPNEKNHSLRLVVIKGNNIKIFESQSNVLKKSSKLDTKSDKKPKYKEDLKIFKVIKTSDTKFELVKNEDHFDPHKKPKTSSQTIAKPKKNFYQKTLSSFATFLPPHQDSSISFKFSDSRKASKIFLNLF